MAREFLVTNDDGFSAKGINVLAEFLRKYGNVIVVAPLQAQSGKAASITLDRTLEIDRLKDEPCQPDGRGSLQVYTLTGTPVDCTKMGINIFKHEGKLPDFLVSGINHGSNASTAALYSGTLGATKEGTVYEIPSIGLSIDSLSEDPDFSGLLRCSEIIFEKIFETGFKKGVYLNINFPALPFEQIKGIKMAHQGKGRWIKEFEHRISPRGRHYFWMMGQFEDIEPADASKGDHRIVADGYVSIVPHRIDTTDYDELERLKNIWNF